jgi:hypothetical protein
MTKIYSAPSRCVALTGITDQVADFPRPSTLPPPGWQPPPMGPDEEPVPF